MVDYSNQADAAVADLPNVGPVTGSELLYADNGTADVNITTGQIKAYAKAGLAAGDVAGLAAVATSGSAIDVGLGNVTNDVQTKAAVVPNTAPAAGQVLAGNAAGTAYVPVSVSGDATLASSGAFTVNKLNGVPPGPFYNGTDAANLSGTINNARLSAIPNTALANSSITIAGHTVALGGSQALAASDVGLGSVTNDTQTKAAIVPNTAPTAGQVPVGSGTAYVPKSVSGDATLDAAGALTVTKTSGVAFGSAATKNIGTTTGTVAAGDDSRITGSAQKAANLSDLADLVAARSSLGMFASRAAAIAASVPVVLAVLTTSGYASAGDGGHGMYQRIAAPSPVKAWHFQSADGAYWKLISEIVRPEHFGAKGDNTTDDSAAVQALFDYANAGLPGDCFVPAKSFYCASPISANSGTDGVFGSSNIKVRGRGYGSVLRLEGAPGLILTGNGSTYGVGDFQLSDVQLYATNATNSLVFTTSIYGNVRFNNVVFRGGYSAAHLTSETASQYGSLAVRFNGCTFIYQKFAAIWGESFFENVHVTGGEIQGCEQYGIICSGGGSPNFFSTFTISGTRIERPSDGTTWPNAKPLLHFDNGQQITIDHACYIEDGTNNPLIEIGLNVKGLFVDGNYLSCAVAGGTQANAAAIKFNGATDQVSFCRNRIVAAGTVTTIFDAGSASVTKLTRENNRLIVLSGATVTNGWLDSTDSGLMSRGNTFEGAGTLTNQTTYPEPYISHGGVAKSTAICSVSGGTLTTNVSSGNISSVSRSGAGVFVVTFSKAFVAMNKYQVMPSASASAGSTLTWSAKNNSTTQATVSFFARSDGTALDPDQFGIEVIGTY